jgi:hypothetical protein
MIMESEVVKAGARGGFPVARGVVRMVCRVARRLDVGDWSVHQTD